MQYNLKRPVGGLRLGSTSLLLLIIIFPTWCLANWPGDYSQVFYVKGEPYFFDRCNASEGWQIDNKGKLSAVNFALKEGGEFRHFLVYSMYCLDGEWLQADSSVISPYLTKAGPGQEISTYSDIFSIPCHTFLGKKNQGPPDTCNEY